MNICVTGASGFVGQRFTALNKDHTITALSLRDAAWEETDFSGFDCILHLAGKAHDMNNSDVSAYYKVNVALTEKLVQKAILARVPHLIYISSIKVYGDRVTSVINENSPYNPNDDYGKSKQQAEELLNACSDKINIAIIRPPLIYGPGVKGNMKKLIELSKKNIPLPFGNIDNKRSIVFIDNLVELMTTIINQQATGTFIPLDGEAVSTTKILKEIKKSLGLKPRLIKIPGLLKKIIARIKPDLYIRLFGNYILDDSQTRKQLNYSPKHTFEEGIKKMVTSYESQL